MTNTRTINTLKDLAKVILEEEKEGRYPVKYKLPAVVFSDEGERAELSPHLQAIVEENMVKLSSGNSFVLKLSLKGLIDMVESRGKVESGNDVKVKLDSMGDIVFVMFSESPDVSKLSYNDLLRLRKILDSVCHPKNAQWKYVKLMTMKRLAKLKGDKT